MGSTLSRSMVRMIDMQRVRLLAIVCLATFALAFAERPTNEETVTKSSPLRAKSIGKKADRRFFSYFDSRRRDSFFFDSSSYFSPSYSDSSYFYSDTRRRSFVTPTSAPTSDYEYSSKLTVYLGGISSSQFDSSAQENFKANLADNAGSVCGTSSSSQCTSSDFLISSFVRRSLVVSVQLNVANQASANVGQTALLAYIESSSFLATINGYGGGLGYISRATVTSSEVVDSSRRRRSSFFSFFASFDSGGGEFDTDMTLMIILPIAGLCLCISVVGCFLRRRRQQLHLAAMDQQRTNNTNSSTVLQVMTTTAVAQPMTHVVVPPPFNAPPVYTNQDAAPAAPMPVYNKADPSAPPATPSTSCTSCNAALDPNHQFCAVCGTRTQPISDPIG